MVGTNPVGPMVTSTIHTPLAMESLAFETIDAEITTSPLSFSLLVFKTNE